MLFLWSISLLIALVSLMIGVLKKSWLLLLVCTIMSIPFCGYFLGAKNAWRLVSGIPILLLIITMYFWLNRKRA